MTEEKNEQASETSVYELGYHLLPSIVADELEAQVQAIRSVIEKRGGSFIAEGTPESVQLAHEMSVSDGGKRAKYNRAYFGWLKFELTPEEAVLLRSEDLTANKQILRFTLVVTTAEETRAQLQSAQNNVLREVKTTGTLEKRHTEEKGGEVSEEDLKKSIEDLVGDGQKEEVKGEVEEAVEEKEK